MFVEFETIFGTKVCVKPYDVLGLEGYGDNTLIMCSRSTVAVKLSIDEVKKRLSPSEPIHRNVIEGD